MKILREKIFTSKTTKALRKAIANREGKSIGEFRREVSRKVNGLDANGEADKIGNINRLINNQIQDKTVNPVEKLTNTLKNLRRNKEVITTGNNRLKLTHGIDGNGNIWDIPSANSYERKKDYNRLLDRQFDSKKRYQKYLEGKAKKNITAEPAKSKKQLDKEELDRQIKQLRKTQSVLLFSDRMPEDQKEFSKTNQLKQIAKRGFVDGSGKKLGSARLQQMWQDAATGTRDQLYRMEPNINSAKEEISRTLNRASQLNINGAANNRLKDLADLHNVVFPGKKRITPSELHKQLSRETLDIQGENSIEKAKERLRRKLGITLPKKR